jgi:hypothetical protein
MKIKNFDNFLISTLNYKVLLNTFEYKVHQSKSG